MSNIRPAVISDLPRLEAMGAEFFEVARLDRWFSYNPRDFSITAAEAIASDQGVALVGDGPNGVVGMAIAVAYPVYFNRAHVTAQEIVWWVEPAFRGGPMGAELKRGLETWAKSKGCLTMEMGALEGLRTATLARLYKSKGYAPKEYLFCKRLV